MRTVLGRAAKEALWEKTGWDEPDRRNMRGTRIVMTLPRDIDMPKDAP